MSRIPLRYIILHLQPDYTSHTTCITTKSALHQITSSSCARGDHCSYSANHLRKRNSNILSVHCHPCITTTHLSYSVLSLKLLPPPCALLLVFHTVYMFDGVHRFCFSDLVGSRSSPQAPSGSKSLEKEQAGQRESNTKRGCFDFGPTKIDFACLSVKCMAPSDQ